MLQSVERTDGLAFIVPRRPANTHIKHSLKPGLLATEICGARRLLNVLKMTERIGESVYVRIATDDFREVVKWFDCGPWGLQVQVVEKPW